MAGGMVTMQTGDDGISDEEIVARAEHDPRHFAPLYRRYAKPIHAFVLRRTGDPEQAADITSQVFTRALAALPRYRTGPFRGWIYAIARNVVIDSRRSARLPLWAQWASLVADCRSPRSGQSRKTSLGMDRCGSEARPPAPG